MLALVILLVIALGFVLPTDYRVERSVIIQAVPDTVSHAVLNQESLSQWMYIQDGQLVPNKRQLKVGEQVAIVYQNTDQQGVLTINDVNEQGVRFTVSPKPSVEPVSNRISITSEQGQTQVRWVIEGELKVGLLSPYVAFFANDIAGRNFELSLQRLKALLEN
ncbi:hypothetical protein GCM10027340_02700 [Marinomonas epiphytica]